MKGHITCLCLMKKNIILLFWGRFSTLPASAGLRRSQMMSKLTNDGSMWFSDHLNLRKNISHVCALYRKYYIAILRPFLNLVGLCRPPPVSNEVESYQWWFHWIWRPFYPMKGHITCLCLIKKRYHIAILRPFFNFADLCRPPTASNDVETYQRWFHVI